MKDKSIKRPRSAYQVYMMHNFQHYKELNPGFKGFELTAQIAKDYKALKPEKKEIYQELYRKEKQKYMEIDRLNKLKQEQSEKDISESEPFQIKENNRPKKQGTISSQNSVSQMEIVMRKKSMDIIVYCDAE